MISLLKEVGRGKRGSRDLNYVEARVAARMLLDGSATAAQIGAFLMAERIKMETQDEIRAIVDELVLRSYRHPISGSMDCAGPYDGRTKSFMATIPVAFVLCACGLPITLHGSEPLPPKWGDTLLTVMQALKIDFTQETLLAGANKTGFLFVPAEEWCPPLKQLRSIREQLGMRTLLNSAEKLIGFSHPSSIALGVFHGTVFEKMAQLLAKLGYTSGIVIQGIEGSEDLSVEKRTRTMILKEGYTDLFIVDPDGLELQASIPEGEWNAARQVEVTLAVLRGEAESVWTNMVILNSAVRLWISGIAVSIEDGMDRSRSALQHGSALRQFLKWIEIVRRHT